jgi:hypothetical protein
MEGCACTTCLLERANRRQAEMIKDLEYRLRKAERELLVAKTGRRWRWLKWKDRARP